jgi:hypothetical protein
MLLNLFIINPKKQTTMTTTTITISNPTPYDTIKLNDFGQEVKVPMTRFIVTGAPEAVEQYYADQSADLAKQGKKPAQRTDEGHPMIHFKKVTAVKYGEEAILTRDVTSDGSAIWFMAEDNSKELAEMIAGASAITQRVFAEKEFNDMFLLSKSYAKNRAINRVNYASKLSGAVKTEATNLDKF